MLLCLEFKIVKDSFDRLAKLRQLNDYFPKQIFHFELSGYIHGKKLLSQPINLDISGEEILHSIDKRVKEL